LGERSCGVQKDRQLVCGDQSGRTSAPISPHVQTTPGHKDRTGVSSGSQSALIKSVGEAPTHPANVALLDELQVRLELLSTGLGRD